MIMKREWKREKLQIIETGERLGGGGWAGGGLGTVESAGMNVGFLFVRAAGASSE